MKVFILLLEIFILITFHILSSTIEKGQESFVVDYYI